MKPQPGNRRFHNLLLRDQVFWVRNTLPVELQQRYFIPYPKWRRKQVTREVIERLGGNPPKHYWVGEGVRNALAAVRKHGEAVLKPTSGSTGVGVVHLAHATATTHDGVTFQTVQGFVNMLGGEFRPDEEWISFLKRETEVRLRVNDQDEWIVEEALRGREEDSPPEEYKLFCFDGHISMIAARKPHWDQYHRATFRWFYPDWTEILPAPSYQEQLNTALLPPEEPFRGQLEAMARKLSRSVLLPFVRVDLYLAETGIHCGELTQRPGAARGFFASIDEHMADMWEKTAKSLAQDIQRGERDVEIKLLMGS